MTRNQWAQVKTLFHEALNVPEADRPAWFARLQTPDPDVVREAQALVRAHEFEGPFLDGAITLDPRDLTGPDPAGPLEEESVVPLLPPGSRIGDYEVRREIGRGGMGVVYLAQDVHLGRPAAIKALPAAMSGDATFVARLRREAQTAAAVSHPGVAMVYAFLETPQGTFIASEFIQGRTLRQEMSRGPLPPARAVRIAIEIVEALCAAHDAHVVHRDLKPENVLLTASGGIKIIDFGIARMSVPGAERTLTRDLQGTPGYMAPEQLLPGCAVDGRADLYALGVILAEMLAGRHPFERPSGITHAQLLALTRRCLESDPDRRYQSSRDLLRDLERISAALDGTEPAAPAEDHHGGRSPMWWWQFHQRAAAAVAALAIVPAWQARRLIEGVTGQGLFFVTLAAIIVATILRLHLLFTSRSNPGELADQVRAERRWILVADLALSLSFIASGGLVGDAAVWLAVLLTSIGIGTAVVTCFIEPATARAAFPSVRSR